ncbi:hypothetical protein T440DRAFT_74267 [Plenodomus tracheiphilus IPT5]|uniref:Uncharacterized protein n=1 Tax=Plenodomus tracheiphilus IPT5 TaxID=1408161 RepID=A0A6A7B948_9PLEO|nr:hypothetical protein T440DRAFT_74267 [Plenodomus tracheiphilus IPT5]
MVLIKHAMISISSLAIANAQRAPKIVPTDLQSGFDSSTQIQASYTGQAVNGFLDGTVFEKNAVSQEPTFALGDSTGISPTTLYTILLIDTTCPNTRILHYARANFKNNFDITNINTSSAALLDYKAPGAFGETGDNRQYSFLLYTNPGRREITELKLPNEGEAFDVKQFQDDNGLPDASAGVGMVVKLGGDAGCGGGEAANTLPASLATPRPGRSSTVAGSSTAVATRTAAETLLTSSRASVVPSGNATVSRGTASPTTAVGQSSQSDDGSSEDATTAVQSGAGPSTITSTIDLATLTPSATGSPTSSGGLAEQTASAGSRFLSGSTWMLVPVLALAFW